jgi:murein DD-endopeptidase MepM/ murein hydrolase activator NlpD
VLPVEVFEGSLDPSDNDEIAPDGLEIMIKRGTPFSVAEEASDEEGNSYVKLLVGGQQFSKPLVAWVSKENFASIFSQQEGLVYNYYDPSQSVATLDQVLEFTPYEVAGVTFVPPVKGRLSSKPGMRRHPILKKKKFHAGWDYAAPTGTPVKAAAKGKVTHAGNAGGYGKLIKIAHAEGYETRYAHLSKILVKTTQQVEAGKHIGNVGSTGRSTGPHLHFEKRLNGKPLTE